MKKSKKTYFYLLLPVVMLTGCLSYEKPPLDPARTAYTALKQENMTQLPENMSHLSLVDAQRMALQNNADFQTIRFALEAAKARYYQSYSSYAPVLNVGMSLTQAFSNMQ